MPNAIFVQDGQSLDYTPAAAVSAGAIVNLGALIGIAKTAIAASALGALAIEGVYDVLKSGSTGPVFAIGDPVFWDSVNSLAVRTGGSGCWHLGQAIAAAATGDTTVRVQLAPHGLPASLQDKVFEDVTLASASKTLDAEDTGKVINITAGHATNVVTLPATQAGLTFTVRCGVDGARVALSPNAADKLMGPDIAGVDNKDHILTAATAKMGDYANIVGDGTNGYWIGPRKGIWTVEA